jgi:hypothetical protein
LKGNEDKFNLRTRNHDLEQEADYFGYALLVPIRWVDGTMSICDISSIFDVSNAVAYEAALLAKDYHRSKAILST